MEGVVKERHGMLEVGEVGRTYRKKGGRTLPTTKSIGDPEFRP